MRVLLLSSELPQAPESVLGSGVGPGDTAGVGPQQSLCGLLRLLLRRKGTGSTLTRYRSGLVWSDSIWSPLFQLVKMFGFILDRPLIHDQLRPHLVRLEEMVLEELDQIEQLFFSQREESDTFCMFTPSHAARLCWSQQLRRRAETTLNHHRTLQQL